MKLGKGSRAAEQGRARQGRAGQTWEEECAAREAGGPVRQDQGKDSWEVQMVVAWTSRRAAGAAKGPDGGVLGGVRGVKGAEELGATMGCSQPEQPGVS